MGLGQYLHDASTSIQGYSANIGHRLNPGNWPVFQESEASKKKKDRQGMLNDTGAASNSFAGQSEADVGAMNNESQAQRDYLRSVASGQVSLSGQQLRQGLQQNVNAQRSMAASAAPSNAPMAALHAQMNAGRLGSAMAGQAATAGIQERMGAQQTLGGIIQQQRQGDINAALGSRGNAVGAYGGTKPEQGFWDKYGGAISAGVGAAALMSDRRVKTDVASGDADANRAIAQVRPYTYRYKGEGQSTPERLGIMAQDLERAGLGHAVMQTPAGKAVNGAALATSNTAMLAALGRRVAELEGKRKGAAAALRQG